jgi:DNA-binding transcriptional LysR family regulator
MVHQVDLSRADLNLLVLFEVVLEEGHVGRAAQRLNLSPSAVSHGIGRLRQLLNDPVFVRTPKGVVPSARALELAEAVSDILARVRGVVATAKPFDPGHSNRRFVIGAPDAASAVILPPLLAELRQCAPQVNLSVQPVTLPQGGRGSQPSWATALDTLDARIVDIAILPVDDLPARFIQQTLYEEDFVIATREGHPFVDAPSLDQYCAMPHLLVSSTGDPHGQVDEALIRQGRSRRVALTVPSFMQALALLAQTDLLAALPRQLVAAQAPRFRLTSTEAPFPLRRYQICAVATRAAMMDAGVAWLFSLLAITVNLADSKIGNPGRRREPNKRLAKDVSPRRAAVTVNRR